MQTTLDDFIEQVQPNFDSDEELDPNNDFVPISPLTAPQDQLNVDWVKTLGTYSGKEEDIDLPQEQFTGKGPCLDADAFQKNVKNPVLTETGEIADHPYNYYCLTFDEEWYTELANNTNSYIQQKQKEKYAVHVKVRTVQASLVMLFHAIIIYMSIFPRSSIINYWKTFGTGLFGLCHDRICPLAMSRDTFLFMWKFFHAVNNEDPENTEKLTKKDYTYKVNFICVNAF
jgi:hypothetical protein